MEEESLTRRKGISMTRGNVRDFIQSKSSSHRVYATQDVTPTRNPNGETFLTFCTCFASGLCYNFVCNCYYFTYSCSAYNTIYNTILCCKSLYVRLESRGESPPQTSCISFCGGSGRTRIVKNLKTLLKDFTCCPP